MVATAPKWKGRPRKVRKKRSNSPGSESNESESSVSTVTSSTRVTSLILSLAPMIPITVMMITTCVCWSRVKTRRWRTESAMSLRRTEPETDPRASKSSCRNCTNSCRLAGHPSVDCPVSDSSNVNITPYFWCTCAPSAATHSQTQSTIYRKH